MPKSEPLKATEDLAIVIVPAAVQGNSLNHQVQEMSMAADWSVHIWQAEECTWWHMQGYAPCHKCREPPSSS